MNLKYNRGRAFEYKVKKEWELAGYRVFRSAGSKSPADLIALKDKMPVRLIQCKASKKTPGRIERLSLIALAEFVGATPVVAYRPTGRGSKYLICHENSYECFDLDVIQKLSKGEK